MEAYLRGQGFLRDKKLNYTTYIGIRADEMDRVYSRFREEWFQYPLVDLGVTREDVIAFWAQQSVTLALPDAAYGNCVWCWKKADSKLMRIAREQPDFFDFPARMEKLYRYVQSPPSGAPRTLFRGRRTVADILAGRSRENGMQQPPASSNGGCGDTCEVYADTESLRDNT